MSTSGKEKILYSFTGGSDGAFPDAGLIDVKGLLYGMTGGGFTMLGCYPNCGNVFSMSASGAFHLIYTFRGAPNDGASPFGNLIGVKDVLYGATEYGGSGSDCAALSGVTGLRHRVPRHKIGEGTSSLQLFRVALTVKTPRTTPGSRGWSVLRHDGSGRCGMRPKRRLRHRLFISAIRPT